MIIGEQSLCHGPVEKIELVKLGNIIFKEKLFLTFPSEKIELLKFLKI